jgi:hypothetical protein
VANSEQRLSSAYIDATDLEIERFLNRLEMFLKGELSGILEGIKTGNTQALGAAKILGGIKTSLRDAGLTKQFQALDKLYGVQLKFVSEFFSEAAIGKDIFSDADFKVVESLIKLDTSIMEGEILKTADQVASTVMRQVIGGQKLDVDELASGFSVAARRNLQTEITTSISGYHRSVTQAKAKELDINYFVYIGPQDGITRPFCKSRINKVYTKEQIAKWDNGTNLSAAIYAGGYNCRHNIVPLSKERAEQRVAEGSYTWG